MTKSSSAKLSEAADSLVPDPVVWRELGISAMTGWRWTRDPNLRFPAAIQIRKRNFRSRRGIEAFKQRMLRDAMERRDDDRRQKQGNR
jgi:hypothetical protein